MNIRSVLFSLVVVGLFSFFPSLIGSGTAAADYSYGQSGNGNSGNSNAGNSTSSHGNSGNQTSSSSQSNGQQNNSNAQSNGRGHGHNAYERMQDYVNETAQSRHQEHLSMNAPITGPFTANLNYTVNANGNATAISNNSMTENATLTLSLSIWKSTNSVVSMDIMNGTLKIGNSQTQIYSGHAYYLENKPRLLVYGFIVDNGTSGPGNSSSSGHSVRLMKLFMSGDGGTLPASSSDPALQVTVLDPESKVASQWFLNMNGQVQRS